MKRIIEEELNIYDPTDDYDESLAGEDDVIEVSDIDNGNNFMVISIVGIIAIALFCGIIFLLVAEGGLR